VRYTQIPAQLSIGSYLRIIRPMRRKPGMLVPLEIAICLTAADLHREGMSEFHGYELAKKLADETDHKSLAAYGTLYRALGRLQDMGLLKSKWEDPRIAARESRPGRRLYTLTAAGHTAAKEAKNAELAKARRARRGWAPA
jgi:DNA-binding PadR family transcriptional regulator